MREEYPCIVGVAVVGSTAKGFAVPESDYDLILVIDNPSNSGKVRSNKLVAALTDHAKTIGIWLCPNIRYYFCYLPKVADFHFHVASFKRLYSPILSGLFIGDQNKRKEIIEKILALSEVDPGVWELIRERSFHPDEYGAIYRLGLFPDEILFIQHVRRLLWHLPDLETAQEQGLP